MSNRNSGSRGVLKNINAAVEIDEYGGAIRSFYLNENGINPLSFELPLEEMQSAKATTSFKGHFLCLGRWGPPSSGELAAGAVKHGDFAVLPWELLANRCERELNMHAVSRMEGLDIKRRVVLDGRSPVYFVQESVTNVNTLGRFYNMVQHPTIAAPFLDNSTRVFCNADTGFCQSEKQRTTKSYSQWPLGVPDNGHPIDLSMSNKPDNNVYSFILNRQARLGWLIAYTPAARLLMGYIWLRKDYPWINLWQDWSNGAMRYRGLEFGTTGLHEPLHCIVETSRTHVLSEKTIRYIDAGEQVDTCYVSFLLKMDTEPGCVTDVSIVDNEIIVKAALNDYHIGLADKINLF